VDPAQLEPDGIGLLEPADPHADDEAVADPRQRRLILITMCVALIGVVASVSSLNVAQQAIAADLGASQGELLWVINGYTLVLAALLLPVGAIGDRWGRKPILSIGLVIFAAANVASAFANTPATLITLRVVAGVAAAMIMPVTLAVITTSFPAHERARAVGTWAGVAGGGGILGLFTSAAIVDNATWPWVFAVPVALGVVALAATVIVVPHSREHGEAGFDVYGAVLSALAAGGLVLGIQEGPERGWTHPITIAGLTIGIVAAAAFVRIELRRDHPLLDVRLFRHRGLATGSVNLFVIFGLMFALFLVVVQLLQAVFGYSALRAATGLLPMAVLMMPLSTVAPTIAHRIGYRRTVVTGMLLVAAGMALLAALADVDRGYLSVVPGLVVLAVGVGLAMSPSTTAITASLPVEKQGVASALNDTAREMGAALGIALFGSILNARYRANISDAAAALPPELAEPVRAGIGGALAVAGQLGPEGSALLEASRNAWIEGMRPTMWLAAAIALTTAGYTAWSAIHAAPGPEAATGPTSRSPSSDARPG
jgi:EmrB/QacA subfamily drug resistance transporter